MLADLVVVLDEVRRAGGSEVAAAHDPVTGGLVEADGVVSVAITGVDHLVRVVLGLVVEHRAAGAGAMGIRVPVESRVDAPVAVEAVQVFQRVGRNRGLGVGTIVEVDAGQLHLAVLEVEGLADAEALALEAIGLDPAVGHAQGNLVGIADAVAAGEAVVTPQRRVAEGGFAGIEQRDVGLVLFRYVEVEQPRLQGLGVVLAEELGLAVEEQATVQAVDRYLAILAAMEGLLGQQRVLALLVQVKVVLGIGVLDLRLEVAPGPVHRQADAGLQVGTITIGASQAAQVVVVPG
ncbi:hypothetical protein D9M68_623760 [compost metagenome]